VKSFRATCDQDYLDHWNSRTDVLPNGCRQWNGPYRADDSKNRYTQVNYCGKRWSLHRIVYTLTKGQIPEGQVVRHKCDNSLCINPVHLELGTQYDNCQDAKQRGRYWHHESRFKVCKRGHEFTPENTWVCVQGFRHCRTCQRLRMQTPEYKARQLQASRRRRARQKVERHQQRTTLGK
jgi:hypothetical protein